MDDDEYDQHQKEVVEPELEARNARGGMWIKIDGEEYWAPTVEELKANGFKVQLRHHRYHAVRYNPAYARLGIKVKEYWSHPVTKGGYTSVLLLAPDGYWAEGYAHCSRKDTYSKKAGYVLAVNRALSELPGELYSFDKPFIDALKDAEVVDG